MKAKVEKAFLYADEGIHVREVPVGAEVEGDVAVQGVAGGWAKEIPEGSGQGDPGAKDGDQGQKAVGEPENKSQGPAPKNKSKG